MTCQVRGAQRCSGQISKRLLVPGAESWGGVPAVANEPRAETDEPQPHPFGERYPRPQRGVTPAALTVPEHLDEDRWVLPLAPSAC